MESTQQDLYRPAVSATTTACALCIVVPYTTPALTQAALQHAAVCSELEVYVRLVDVQVVPFPCALDDPPLDREHSRRRLSALFGESGLPGETAVVYTRDWLEAYNRILEPESLVVVAVRKRWWPTREKRLARALTKAGHQVVLVLAGG